MKKLISLILALMTLLSVAVFSTGAAETSDHYYLSLLRRQPISVDNGKVFGYLGDVDNSQDINILDATQIQLNLARLADFDETQTLLADADLDKSISILDVTAIQCYIAKVGTDPYIAHTLYVEYDCLSHKEMRFNELVSFLKDNSEYDSDLKAYVVTDAHDTPWLTSTLRMSYFPKTDEISIFSDQKPSNGYTKQIMLTINRKDYEAKFSTAVYSRTALLYTAKGSMVNPVIVNNGYAYTFYCDTFDSVAYDNFSEVETELTDILYSALGATESVAEAYISGYIEDLFIPEIKIG